MEILHPRHRDSTTNHMESAPPVPLPGGIDMLAAVIDANIGSPRRRLEPTSQPKPAAQAARPFTTAPSTADPLDGDFPVDDTGETPLFRLMQSVCPGAA